MSLVILFAIAAVILFVGAFAMTNTKVQEFARQHYQHLLALSALLVPVVVVLSACNDVSSL
jgi:hypothetical protein